MINWKGALSVFLIFVMVVVCVYGDNADVLCSPEYMLVLAENLAEVGPPPRLLDEEGLGKTAILGFLTSWTVYQTKVCFWIFKMIYVVGEWAVAPTRSDFTFSPDYGKVDRDEVMAL